MPFPLLAHQAPVLPLLVWKRRWFNGTALVLGSVAPDFEYLVHPARPRGFAHSVTGQIFFCLPLTVALVIYLGRLGVANALASRLGSRMLRWVQSEAFDSLPKIAASAIVGSFSHVGLDVFTHTLVPLGLHSSSIWHWRGMAFNAASLSQLTVTALGTLLTVVVLRRALVTMSHVPANGPVLLLAAALVGAGAGLWRVLPAIRNPNHYFFASYVYVWGHVAFHAACGTFIAWLIAGGLLAWRDARAPRE